MFLATTLRSLIRRLLLLDADKDGWTGARLAREEEAVLSSALLVAAAGAGLATYRLCDREARALRFYVRRQKAAYAVMTACLLILGACVASHGRFLMACVVGAVRSQVTGRVMHVLRRGKG